MKTIVQKFGGTSLDTAELRARVSDIISTAINDGYYVAVVVSAMGRKNDPYSTDTLINLVKQININPDIVELDTLMSCGEIISGIVLSNLLKANGIASRFLNAEQAGIVTDNNHGSAHILYVNSENILKCFEQGITPVIAGFQGINEKGQITTLGRGGSDTTASAVGVALDAEYIDIYTDVEGVMTADPRIVKDARLLKLITYNEICQLAREGAKVIHPRAVEIAMQKAVPIRVRSTKSDKTGTIVANHYPTTEDRVNIIRDRLITGITYTSDIVQIKILKNDPALANDYSMDLVRAVPWGTKNLELKIFKSLALANISVDFISIQTDSILFTVNKVDLDKSLEVLKNLDIETEVEIDCAKVAVVGAAMTGVPGIMAKVVEALSEVDISILRSGDSYTNIWCLIKRDDMEKAVMAFHDKFGLAQK